MPFEKGMKHSPESISLRRLSRTGIPVSMTYQEVGEALGISRMTVQRLEKSALRKLRTNPATKELFHLVNQERGCI